MQKIIVRFGGKLTAFRLANGKYMQLFATIAGGAAPIYSALPTLTGANYYIGTTLTVGAGAWTGAESVTRDLMRGGDILIANVSIGAAYTPVEGDDLQTLYVREIARAGNFEIQVTSPSRAIKYTPPAFVTPIANQTFVQGSGTHTIDADANVTGQNLAWAITGPAGIGVSDGDITLPAATVMAATDITVTVTNSGGSASDTFTLTVTVAAPTSSGVALPAQSYTQGSGTNTFAASVGFSGQDIVYSLVSPPAGVSVNASTGVISTTTGSLIPSTTITVRATNGGGSLDRSFSLAVVAATGVAPTLSGTPLPSKLGLERGSAASTQATAQAFTGTVTSYSVAGAGVSINAATGVLTFSKAVTQAEQTVTVTAANGYGSASATFQMSVRMKPISLSDVALSFDADPTGASATGVPRDVPAGFNTWTVDLDESQYPETIAAVWWRGDAHVVGQGPGTGYFPMIRDPAIARRWIGRAVAPVTGAPIIRSFLWVNDPQDSQVGASKTQHFIYTADTAGNLIPGPLNVAATITNASPSVATATAHGFQNTQIVRLTTTGALPAPLVAGTSYFVVNAAANTLQLSLTLGGAAIATTSAGSGVHTISALNREFSSPSPALVQVVALPGGQPVGTEPRSRIMPLASIGEFSAAGYVAGDGLQIQRGAAQCLAQPHVGVWAHDSGGMWITKDFGVSWWRPTQRNLSQYLGQGIAIDPVNPNRIFLNAGSWSESSATGLWASTDGGESWSLKMNSKTNGYLSSGSIDNNGVGFAPGSIGTTRAEKWIWIKSTSYDGSTGSNTKALYDALEQDNLCAFSTDGGDIWRTYPGDSNWFGSMSIGRVKFLTGDPSNDNVFYASTDSGFFRISGSTLYSTTVTPTVTRITVGGSSGAVIDRPYISPDGNTIIVGVKNVGVFKTTNAKSGSRTWTQLGTHSAFHRAHINPWNPNHIITSNTSGMPSFSINANSTGADYALTSNTASGVQRRPGGTYTPELCFQYNFVFFHPDRPGHAVFLGDTRTPISKAAFYRTANYGAYYSLSSEGFVGTKFNHTAGTNAMFDPTDKNKFIFPFIDIGPYYTENGAKSWSACKRTTGSTTNMTSAVTASGAGGTSCFGAAIKPGTDIMLALIDDYSQAGHLIRSEDKAVTWSGIAGTNGQSTKAGAIFYDRANPNLVMWYRYRSVDGNWASWSAMSGLTADDVVQCCTQKLSGTNYFFSASVNSGNGSTIKRSSNGVTWTTVLSLGYGIVSEPRMAVMAVDPFDENILYVRDDTLHRIRRYDLSAGTSSFVRLNLHGAGSATRNTADYPLPVQIQRIYIDPSAPKVIHAATLPYGQTKYWRTTVGGRNAADTDSVAWEALPDYTVTTAVGALTVHPLTGDVFIGSDKGSSIVRPPYKKLSFSAAGTAAFQERQTLTRGNSTGTICRVVLTSGSYAAGTAAGVLYVTGSAGSFAAGTGSTSTTTATFAAWVDDSLFPGLSKYKGYQGQPDASSVVP